MAKCEDCICFKSCQAWCVAIDKALKTDAATEELQKNNAELCPSFKNTADVVEVKHGEWIEVGVGITERVVCSQCKSHEGSFMRPPFCNQCGAKMDKRSTDNGLL